MLMVGLKLVSSLTIYLVPPVTATGNAAKMIISIRDAGELSAVGSATREDFLKVIADRLLNKRYGQKSNEHSLLFDMAIALTSRMGSLKYLEALKYAPIGMIGDLRSRADNIRTRVWNNIVELTTTAVEIERVRLEAVQDNTKENDHLSEEGAGFERHQRDRSQQRCGCSRVHRCSVGRREQRARR